MTAELLAAVATIVASLVGSTWILASRIARLERLHDDIRK